MQPYERVTFPARTWAALAVFGVLMVGLLAALLVLIESQRRQIISQDSKSTGQLREARALGDVARPTLAELRPLVVDLRSARLPQTARATREITAEFLRLDAPQAIRDGGGLARELLRVDAAGAIRDGGDLARELLRADAPGAIRAGRRLADELLRADVGGRVEELARMQRRALELAVDGYGVARSARATARDTLAIQRETLAILREALAVQRETLVRIRSIDQRTGGVLTPGSPGVGP